MKLIDHIGEPFANLEVIHDVLKSYPQEAPVVLTLFHAIATLTWATDHDHCHRSVQIYIPLQWMTDPGCRGDVEGAARRVASGILMETARRMPMV